MSRPWWSWALCAVALGACGEAAAQWAFRSTGAQIPGLREPGGAGLVVADFDGDGRDDVAFAGWQGPTPYPMPYQPQPGFVAIVGYDAARAGYRLKQALVADLQRPAGLASDGAAEPGLVLVSRDGVLAHYVGRPLALLSRFELGRPVQSMRVGDVDGDGRVEVVVADTTAGLAAYDLATGALVRTYAGRFAASIELAQLDADPALEIILAGTPGVVVDGATNATDWRDAGGFGELLAAGRLFTDGREGFVAAGRYLSAYRGAPYSPLWSLETSSNGVDTADIDGDGVAEILHSGNYRFTVLDALTQTVRLQAPHEPIGHMGAARMRDTAAWQFAFGTGLSGWTGSTIATVISAQGEVEFALHAEVPPFRVAAEADVDVDGDGVPDAVWISAETNAGYAGGDIHVVDPATGAERWRVRLPYSASDLSAVLVAPLRASAPADIVVAGHSNYGEGVLYVIDGVTRQERLSNFNTGFSAPIDQLALVAAAGAPRILAAARGTPIQLGLYDGSDLHALWTQPLLAAYGDAVNDLQPLSAAGPEVYLLSTPTVLLAFHLGERRVLWSRMGSTASAGLLYLADGTPVIGRLGASGNLQLLSLDGTTLLADFPLGDGEPGAVRGLADAPGKAVACIDRRIVLVDLDARAVTAQSPWIGSNACDKGSLVLAPSRGNRMRVRASSVIGVFDLDLAGPVIFGDGFDGPQEPVGLE